MNKPPRVSLCVLTYNRASILPRSLDCLLKQTYQDYEIIINDDCSKDNTAAVGKDYELRDPRVRYCRNEHNLRYAGNQNAAVKRSRASDYIAFIHDGDIYREDMLEKWVAAMDRHPSAGFVFNSQGMLNHEGKPVRVIYHPFAELIPGQCMFDACITQPSIPVWGILLVRKSSLLAAGEFSGDFPVLADVDMWLRLMLAHDCSYIREALVYLAPREKGHQNESINWKISVEYERIIWRNLRRRAQYDRHGFEFIESGVRVMLLTRWLTQFLLCLKHGHLVNAWNGVRHYLKFGDRRAAEYGA